MAKIVQRRRGTTTDHNNFPGAAGEITVDLTDKTVRVQSWCKNCRSYSRMGRK